MELSTVKMLSPTGQFQGGPVPGLWSSFLVCLFSTFFLCSNRFGCTRVSQLKKIFKMTYLFTNYTLEQVLEEGFGFAQGNIARVSQ